MRGGAPSVRATGSVRGINPPVGIDFLLQRRGVAGGEALGGGEGDHAGVVGAEGGRGEEESEAVFLAAVGQGLAQALVATDATGDGDGLEVEMPGGVGGLFDEDADDGL